MQFKTFMEALKGKQHKIDKNKNGKIDAQDFKILQKEQLEEGLDPSEVAGNPRMYSADTVKKAFYHKKASESDKQSLAKHLDRHHGNKEWRKPVKEEQEQIDETIKTTHEDPLVTVHDKHGLHTHANLSVANNIFNTKVKHADVHKGKVKTKSGHEDGRNLTFALSQHHAQAVKDEEKFRKQFGEEHELTEATVKTQKYSWGTMKTVHHGADFSIPLHPEHHQAIAKLKDEQEHKFKTEDGKHWTARRKGDEVHFQGANNGGSTKVKHEELKESEDRMARADYKTSPSGRKSHKEIVFGDAEKKDKIDEKAPPGFEGTVKAMKKHKEIDNPYALAWYMKNKGMKSHKKEDGTMKEAFINGREYASHGLMHPDHAGSAIHKVTGNTIDFYAHGSGDKVSGKVTKNDGKAVHIKDTSGKTHQFKVSTNLPKKVDESKKEDPPFDGPYKKAEPVKNSDGTAQSPMSRARELAQMAIKKKMKEEFGLDITDAQAQSLVEAAKGEVGQIRSLASHVGTATMQQLGVQAGSPVEPTAKDKEKKPEKKDAPHHPVAPTIDRKYIKGTPEHTAYKATKKPINGHPTNKEEVNFDDDGTLISRSLSYKDFLQMNEIKMSDLPSRIVRGHSYGANYEDPEGADDYDDKKPVKPAPEKRGRGRPAGAQSGARKNLGNSKLHTK